MVKQLQRFRRGEAVTALPSDTWNAFCDTAEKVAQDGQVGDVVGNGVSNPVIVQVRNQTGSTVAAGGVYGVNAMLLNQERQLVVDGVTPADADHWTGLIAIPFEPAVNGSICKAVLSGLVRARVNVTNTQIVTYDIADGDESKLTGHLAGRARLVVPASSTGEQDLWVFLGGTRQIDWTGTASGGITAGATGTVSVDGFTSVSVTASLDKFNGSENISSGKEVGVKWYDHDHKWRIVHADCE